MARGSWLVARGSWLVALVLVVAAVFKLFTVKPLPSTALTNLIPEYAMGLIPWFEIGLAFWLISRKCRFGSWVVAVVTFAIFSVQAILLTIGQKPSCGCLGNVTLPPVVTLVADLAILGLLGFGWPRWKGWPELTPMGRTFLKTVATAAVLVLSAAGWANWKYGSIQAAVSVARGDPATLLDNALNLGEVPADGSAVSVLRVRNNTGDTIQIALAESGCSCTRVRDLPINISPGAVGEVSILVTVSSEPGEFRRNLRLQTSVGVLPYTIAAAVVPTLPEIVP